MDMLRVAVEDSLLPALCPAAAAQPSVSCKYRIPGLPGAVPRHLRGPSPLSSRSRGGDEGGGRRRPVAGRG